MRVVVIGATGNVGSSLVRALGDAPEVDSILGVARREPEWAPPKTEWATADIARDDSGDHLVRLLAGADAVVHLAWLFQPSHDPLSTWNTNVVGSRRILDAVARSTVPALVYASSVGAYSPGPKDRAVDETWPTHGWPTAGYTREKSYVERLVDAFELRHPDRRVVRLRPGFIFGRESAAQQRRLFAGPLLPGRLVRSGLVPAVPDLPGLRFQALHSADAADAYRLAVVRQVRGAFNVAAEPVIDAPKLAELLDARAVQMSSRPVRSALAAAWHLRLVPAPPHLFDALLHLPLMDTTRARKELGWSPTRTATEAFAEFLRGLREGAGGPTPPLHRHAGGRVRQHEFATGSGSRG
ncbi:MAG TPA: NAD-dependent epimerase/dehydratase family protein [Mycobacteriales bacterium]|nr:NAD-dependent epimerase/dehydratase family protein [Mycobacteriales bacterium]